MSVSSIILAAGKGTRMKSDIPKVLNPIHGRPMLQWVVDALNEAGIQSHCLVICGDIAAFEKHFNSLKSMTVCEQIERKGTGDAVASAHDGFRTSRPKAPYNNSKLLYGHQISSDYVLICTGDTPNIASAIIKDFIDKALDTRADLSVLGMTVPNPFGYGRILQDDSGRLKSIVEEKDANEHERQIKLCNSGLAFGRTELVFECVHELTCSNAQNEYYFTDVFSIAREKGKHCTVYSTDAWQTFAGVNTREQLLQLEAVMQGESK